jgi:hypothetical protein
MGGPERSCKESAAMKNVRRRTAFFFLLLSTCAAAFAAPRVAVLPPENKTGDPRLDYVGGIVQGLLQFDLASDGAVELVDRSTLDAALRERELSLSAVAADPSKTAGALLPADYLLSCDYAILSQELLFTVKLVDVLTSRASTFSEGGSTENAVHALAERVAEKLTGKRPVFRGEGRGRSLLSLRDETPGSIALHSPLVDALIYLDGEFIGYTLGDRRKPYLIEGVSPGDHVLSTDLGNSFGVVGLPEISFGPWKKTVRVQSGKRAVVMDESTHFNEVLYRLMRLVDESRKVEFDAAGSARISSDFSFVDRTGARKSGSLSVAFPAGSSAESGSAVAEFVLGGERRSVPLAYGPDAPAQASLDIGLVTFEASVAVRYGRVEVELDAERNDIRQGMFAEEAPRR